MFFKWHPYTTPEFFSRTATTNSKGYYKTCTTNLFCFLDLAFGATGETFDSYNYDLHKHTWHDAYDVQANWVSC